MSGKKPKLKVLVLAHSPENGGAGLALSGLIKTTVDTYDWTVVFTGKRPPDEPLKEGVSHWEAMDLPWWCYEAHDTPPTTNRPLIEKNLKRLKQLAAQADILLTNTLTVPWLGFIAGEVHKPHLWYIHEFGDIDHKLKFHLGHAESLAVISDTSSIVLAISQAVKDYSSRAVDEKKIEIIHQSIDLNSLLALPEKTTLEAPVRLLCAGAIKPSKGQEIALEAARLLGPSYANLTVAGPNAHANYAEKITKNVPKNATVSTGFADLFPLYERADVVVMCSGNEALGRVTLEAMAAGRPAIGYDCPATRELLGDGRGVLYTPNTPEALAAAIKQTVSAAYFDTGPARQYASELFSVKRQNSDFKNAVENAQRRGAPQYRPNFYQEYMNTLEAKGLLVSVTRSRLGNLKLVIAKCLPRPVKKVLKRARAAIAELL
jgi:glycosyltransferase involved in cell wall biosynthesis